MVLLFVLILNEPWPSSVSSWPDVSAVFFYVLFFLFDYYSFFLSIPKVPPLSMRHQLPACFQALPCLSWICSAYAQHSSFLPVFSERIVFCEVLQFHSNDLPVLAHIFVDRHAMVWNSFWYLCICLIFLASPGCSESLWKTWTFTSLPEEYLMSQTLLWWPLISPDYNKWLVFILKIHWFPENVFVSNMRCLL